MQNISLVTIILIAYFANFRRVFIAYVRKCMSIISIGFRHTNVNTWHRSRRRNPFRRWQVDQMTPPAGVLMPVAIHHEIRSSSRSRTWQRDNVVTDEPCRS